MTASDASAVRPPGLWHRIAGGFIGNVVEWYDFAVYGYLAGVIAPVFFPAGSQTAALIGTYGIFAAGFLMRPLGAALFGWFGDRHGRARTMQISVVLMAVPTLLLGLLPTYASVGLLAPVLLVVVRLVQGLSVGGEFSSSATYLVETAPEGKRGLTGSWANIGSLTGSLLGVGAAALVTTVFDADTLAAWGWRVPFLAGAVLGTTAILVRRNLHTSERFAAHHAAREATSPLLQAFTTNRRETLLAVAFASAYGASYYLAFVYLPEWLSSQGLMPRSTALTITTAMMVLVIPAMPLTALVGDRLLPRRTWVGLSLLVLAVSAWPLYAWMVASSGSTASVVVATAVGFALLAVPLGSAPALFVEMFPEADRLSGYSVAFNIGLGVVGGTTPIVATALIATTGNATVPALYMAAAGVVAVVALAFTPDRSRAPLR